MTYTLRNNNENRLSFLKSCLFVLIILVSAFSAHGQCSLTVNVSSSSPAICSGSAVTLTATASGGTGPYTYTWNTGATTATTNINAAGTYTVIVSDKTPGCQPVSKSITISASPVPNAPTAANQTICPGTAATLKATAPGGTYQWYDSNGVFLFTGDTYTTPAVNVNSVYYVETTLNGCTSARTPVNVYLTSRPFGSANDVCEGTGATLTASGAQSYQWYSTATSTIPISESQSFTTGPLTANTTYYLVGINNGCVSPRVPVTVNVVARPATPIASDVSICSGSTASLHAQDAPGIFAWYDVPAGGSALILSPDYTTPPLTASKTYYVQSLIGGCESERKAVNVTVYQIPATPADQTVSACPGQTVTLTAGTSTTNTYNWYDMPTGGNLITTGPTYTLTNINNSVTYYVEATNGHCPSGRAAIRVNVNPVPPSPSVTGAVICFNSSATLTVNGPGGTYNWYDAPTGGTHLMTGPSYNTPVLQSNTTYYVETTLASGCTSARTPVTVTVQPQLTNPTASGITVCSGSSGVVTASGSSGSFEWYDSANGGNLLSSEQSYVTPALTATTTYYVQGVLNNCTTNRVAVTVTVNPIPTQPSVSGSTTICANSSATLTASVPSGTIDWYDAPSGGNHLVTGNVFTTPGLTASTTYYVQNTIGQCSSARKAITVTVNTQNEPQFQYPTGTACTSSPNITPTINNPSGGQFSVTPAGLVFVSNTTGEINLSASATGTYTITFTGNGTCATPESATFTISSTGLSTFAYKPEYCKDENNPFPNYSPGSSGGVFSASPAGLFFVNTSTGEIDLKKSTPGTYTITNTIPATSGCAGSNNIFVVKIDPSVTINAGPDQTVASGSTVQLNGSVSGGTGSWSGGSGSFSNKNITNPIYTPSPGETSAVLTYTSDDPPGLCGPKSDQVAITFSTAAAAPTVSGNSTCAGSTATLTASSPNGGTYKWYNVATGGTPIQTGPTFITPALFTNTTYYVDVTNNGITSTRTATLVTVTGTLPPPAVTGLGTGATTACAGGTTKLDTDDPAGYYEWYDAATGGNLINIGSSYTTPVLYSNQTYYVLKKVNNCISPRAQVNVNVSSVPSVTSAAIGTVCSGTALSYTITTDNTAATVMWSRDAVTGISNTAVTNQTTTVINEVLTNTTASPVVVTYLITPTNGTCTGSTFQYKVIVYPTPAVSSPANQPAICNQTPVNYQITFNTSAQFEWSRAQQAGISNAPVSGQTSSVIKEFLTNTTSEPVDVKYQITSKTSSCQGIPFTLTVPVNPTAVITSGEPTVPVCSSTPQNYQITSNIASATYSWSRALVPGISNGAVTNQTSGIIDEALINTVSYPVKVTYVITPTAYGCAGQPFYYIVTVNPQPAKPVAHGSTVCVDGTITLQTPVIPNATYHWTGPGGFSDPRQNPTRDNATEDMSGVYSLYVTVGGCTSEAGTTTVQVKPPSVAIADVKGRTSILACVTDQSVQLDGNVTGGTNTGFWSGGSNNFQPSRNALNAQYIPTDADRAAGSVVLTLTSTSDAGCTFTTSNITINFGKVPVVNAGEDQQVCNQSPRVQLHGNTTTPSSVTWTVNPETSGTFLPDIHDKDATYIPSATDIKNGSVKLTLTANTNNACDLTSDDVTIFFIPPPTVSPGGTRYVLKGRTITLTPTVSDNDVAYLWTPNVDINDNKIKNPTITGTIDRVYTLIVTDKRGCSTPSETFIKVSPEVVIPNTFTPNGDGINDVWNIQGLIAYTEATVDIFTRYGQKVYHSVGYNKPWDGTFNGNNLPTGVYYYVIDTKMFNQVLSGSITIIR